ncbi:hypothetical protein FB451DRAFT_1167703 [Mycena latifolia]|nr:hypothetical protein FB451DRAFT_1167703 [Mycena latifolia]
MRTQLFLARRLRSSKRAEMKPNLNYFTQRERTEAAENEDRPSSPDRRARGTPRRRAHVHHGARLVRVLEDVGIEGRVSARSARGPNEDSPCEEHAEREKSRWGRSRIGVQGHQFGTWSALVEDREGGGGGGDAAADERTLPASADLPPPHWAPSSLGPPHHAPRTLPNGVSYARPLSATRSARLPPPVLRKVPTAHPTVHEGGLRAQEGGPPSAPVRGATTHDGSWRATDGEEAAADNTLREVPRTRRYAEHVEKGSSVERRCLRRGRHEDENEEPAREGLRNASYVSPNRRLALPTSSPLPTWAPTPSHASPASRLPRPTHPPPAANKASRKEARVVKTTRARTLPCPEEPQRRARRIDTDTVLNVGAPPSVYKRRGAKTEWAQAIIVVRCTTSMHTVPSTGTAVNPRVKDGYGLSQQRPSSVYTCISDGAGR